jgi:hypothetical protein
VIPGARGADRGVYRRSRPATGLDRGGWIDRVQALPGARQRSAASRRSSWFRLGDRYLQVVSDWNPFLDEFEALYRDCIASEPRLDQTSVRCDASRLPGSSLLCLSFDGRDLPDPISAAGTPFRMLRHLARYAEVPGPAPGWRMVVDGEDGGLPLAAGDGRRLVIDLDEAPAEFATDCVVSLLQAAQRDLLFLHAASFGIAGAGALLVGSGQAGKSTTTLALTARGHSFLGDDVAAIRTRTREILPFPKVVSLRPGPYVRSLGARLRATRHATSVGPDGQARTLVSMGDLFPASAGGVLPLRFVFMLDGFAAHARLTPFRPGIADVKRLKGAVSESIPSWGLSPGRDLMRFLTVLNVLSGLECYLVELGSPEDSAAAIEAVMEGACHST